jgi:hypothetical protein
MANSSLSKIKLPVAAEEVGAVYAQLAERLWAMWGVGVRLLLWACSAAAARRGAASRCFAARVRPRCLPFATQHRTSPQLEFFAEEEPITIIPSFQLRHKGSNGMLSCIGVSCCLLLFCRATSWGAFAAAARLVHHETCRVDS